ncbi:hypothetical protein RvY_08573 [Ramazzottius varieornatus]|uniref:Core-binding (CB) domain-containing protein n=1 Tax=Ramazzottius varieornatus TaxID=947166 RepID=A0A1D1VAY6_RAMVA|nr:hypothetical protein RvY_08573 [Ramazzottius varieornatus]
MSTIAAENNFTFTLKNISGVDNSIADSLSRFQNSSVLLILYPAFRTAPSAGSRCRNRTSSSSKYPGRTVGDLRPLVPMKYRREVDDLLHHHISGSTRNTYSTGVRQYILFCQSHALNGLRFTPDVLLQYLGYLHAELLSFSTAKVYLSGIDNYIVEEGHPSLLKHTAIQRSLLGFKSLHPPPNDRRLPITLPITLPILRHIHRKIKNPPSLPYLRPERTSSGLPNLLHGVAHLDRYSTHYFRIGAATEASNQGRGPEEIQQAGRWKSSCYNGYIRNKKHTMGLYAYHSIG